MGPFDTCSVYVIGPDAGAQKIGIARSPVHRLATMQVGSAEDLRLHYVRVMDRVSAYDVEKSAHRLLRDKHRRGEWFDVTPQEARAAVDASTLAASQAAGDALEVLVSAGALSARHLEAALAYRELHLVGFRDTMATEGKPANGRPTKVTDARMKLYSLESKIKAVVGPTADPLMVGVVAHGVGLNRFVASPSEARDKVQMIRDALDVVADELDRAISA